MEKLKCVIANIDNNMVNEVKELADLTVGRGLVTKEEVLKSVGSDISFVLTDEKSNEIIGFSLNEKINAKILSSIYEMCDTIFCKLEPAAPSDVNIYNLGALGIAPKYQHQGYGKSLFHAVVDPLKLRADSISALAWKKGDSVPMHNLLEQAGFKQVGILKSPYKDVPGIYCDYCKSDVCECDSCLYVWGCY